MTYTKWSTIQLCSLIIKTINQHLDELEMIYNNKFQLIYKSIIHNLIFILYIFSYFTRYQNLLISNTSIYI